MEIKIANKILSEEQENYFIDVWRLSGIDELSGMLIKHFENNYGKTNKYTIEVRKLCNKLIKEVQSHINDEARNSVNHLLAEEIKRFRI